MKIFKTPLPGGSALKSLGGQYVHIDSYAASFNGGGVTIEEIGKAFFPLQPPRRITALFALRNGIGAILIAQSAQGADAPFRG